MKKYLILLCSVATLSACAASGQQYQQAPLTKGMAQLTVYRPDVSFGQLGTTPITVNGVEQCSLPKNGYFTMDVPAGLVTISTRIFGDVGTSQYPISAKPNERYFVRVSMNTPLVVGQTVGGAIGGQVASNEGSFILRPGNAAGASLTREACP